MRKVKSIARGAKGIAELGANSQFPSAPLSSLFRF